MLSYAYAKVFPVASPRSFHDWVRNQFGERLFQIFFKTYTEKVWGMSCDDISADWAAQRIKGLDLRVAVTNALTRSFRRKPKADAAGEDIVKTLIETFQYPRKGPGMMWEAAAAKIVERGGSILMGRELVGLAYDETQKLWRIEVATADGGRENYTARHVVSSAPVRELVQKLTPKPISLLHARALRYRDFVTVALMLDKPEVFADNWIYIHDPSVKVGRVQNFTLMVAGDGADRHVVSRAGIFLLRGRRPVDDVGPGTHRAGQGGDRQGRPDSAVRCGRRLRGAAAEGLSGL